MENRQHNTAIVFSSTDLVAIVVGLSLYFIAVYVIFTLFAIFVKLTQTFFSLKSNIYFCCKKLFAPIQSGKILHFLVVFSLGSLLFKSPKNTLARH